MARTLFHTRRPFECQGRRGTWDKYTRKPPNFTKRRRPPKARDATRRVINEDTYQRTEEKPSTRSPVLEGAMATREVRTGGRWMTLFPGCLTDWQRAARIWEAQRRGRREKEEKKRTERHVRSEVIDADVLHVDGNIVLVGQNIGNFLDPRVFSDDPLTHLVKGSLAPGVSLQNAFTEYDSPEH